MLRLVALIIPALIVMVGFAIPFFVIGIAGYVLAVIVVGIGGAILWWIEKKTASSLNNDTVLNNIINADTDDTDGKNY